MGCKLASEGQVALGSIENQDTGVSGCQADAGSIGTQHRLCQKALGMHFLLVFMDVTVFSPKHASSI